MRQVMGVLGLVALLAGPARAGDKNTLPDDLKLVSGKAGGFVTARVADLLQSETGKTLFEKLAKMEPKVDIDKELTREIGISLAQMERVTVLLPEDFPREPVVVFRATQAIDREKMFAGLRKRPEKKQIQGRTYYAGDQFGTAYYFVNDRVFVVSSPAALAAWLENDPAKADPGLIRPALLEAAKGAPLVAVIGQPLLNKMVQPLPGELSGPLTAAKTALMTVIAGKDTQLDLRLTFADAKAAQAASGALKGTLGFSREQIPLLRGELNRGNDPQFPLPEAAKWAMGQADMILQQTDKALADARVSAEGTTVTARSRAQVSAGQYILAVGMSGFAVRVEAKVVAPPPPKKEEKKK